MVIRTYSTIISFFASKNLNSSIGKYFVSIHIERSARSCLKNIYNKMFL